MVSYQSRMLDLLRELERAFADVAQLNASKTFQAHSAIYGEAFVRVGYKLGTALLASKEVLLVVVDFPDVQVRNIRTVQDRLALGGDRLQKAIAIVAHRDVDRDVTLRTWGREAGLTILPLCYANGVPSPDQILDRLLDDLYLYDRFDLTGPVRSEYQFFGRRFVPDLSRRLAEGTVHALFGMRKIGKTSLLNRVVDELTERLNCAVIMVDASDDSLSILDAAGLMECVLSAAKRSSQSGTLYESASALVVADEVRPVGVVAQELLETVIARGPTALVIDEVDYLTPSSPTAAHWGEEFNAFFRALRRIYQEATRRGAVFSVVLSGVSSRWFSEESVNGVENAALALVPEGYLSPLDRAESVEMIQALAAACGMSISTAGADHIAAMSSDNPFWIRKAGSYINSCFGTSRPVNVRNSDVRRLCGEFLGVEGNGLAYSSLRHLFGIHEALGFGAVHATEGRPDRVEQEVLSTLGRYGLIDEDSNATGPMIAEGIRRWKARDSNRPQRLPIDTGDATPASLIEAGSPSAAGEEEWAEMLGEVSKLRNLQEARLRALVLKVVRRECEPSGRAPVDVLRAALPADRRDQVKDLGVTALLKSLYWLDLASVIRKNWTWFQQLFGDRSKFDLWSDLVNERPDAHAKEIDGAELALQRKAIHWFRDAIDRAGISDDRQDD